LTVYADAAPSIRTSRLRRLTLGVTFGLVIGVLLVLVFLRFVNIGTILQRLQHLSAGFVVLSGLAFLSAYLVRALRWRWLLTPCIVSVPRAVAIYLSAIFINWLLPLRGGELAKSLMLRRSNGIAVSRSLPTVTMDKAMDLLPAAGLLALLPFIHLRLSRPLWILLLAALAALVLGVALLGFAAWRRDCTLAWLSRVVGIVLPSRIREHVEPFLVLFVDTLIALIRRPRMLLLAAMCTTAAVGFDALFCWLAFMAVGAVVPFSLVLYGFTFFNLAYMLPTPPGQVGSNELIGLLIFSGLLGLSSSTVGAMFLFSHPWTAILMATTGLASLSAMGLTLPATLKLARSRATPTE
jgi:uncharacterized protein (TIRG00374 family)